MTYIKSYFSFTVPNSRWNLRLLGFDITVNTAAISLIYTYKSILFLGNFQSDKE